MFFQKFADKGDNQMDNPNIYKIRVFFWFGSVTVFSIEEIIL